MVKLLAILLCLSLFYTLGCNKVVNITGEVAAIRKLDRSWQQALTSKDAATISNLYASDAVQMSANTPKVVGREAIRKWLDGWLPGPNVSTFAIDTIEVAASGEIAYDRGTFHFSADTPQGHVDDVGKYLTIWKKIGGEWKVIADIDNSDRPCSQ